MLEAATPHNPRSRLAQGYFVLIASLGTFFAGWALITETGLVALAQTFFQGQDWQAQTRGALLVNPTFYTLLVLGVLAEITHIPLPKGGRMTAGFLINFAALLMIGLNAAIAVLGLVHLLTAWLPSRRRFSHALFNVGQLSLAYWAANYALTYGHVYIYGYPGADDNAYVAFATAAYLVVNFSVIDTYLALQRATSPLQILWEEDRTEIFVTLALAPMALLMAYMHQEQGWWGAALVLLPMFTTAYGVRLYIQVKRSEQALAASNQQLTILQQVATRISSQINLDQTLALISQEMRRVVEYHECLIFLLDADSGMLVRQNVAPDEATPAELKLPIAHGLLGEVARERQARRIADLTAGALDVGILAGYRSLLAVPVATDQEILGVIALLHREAEEFDAAAQRLLEILASQASVAIKNAQLYRATQQLAVTDGLTKVYNRRYFEEQLHAELARARRQKYTTSLIVLDVDHFKKFNDTHGHLLGDHVLQGVARILQKSVRETDLVARYGGEEFVVILPETPADAAVEVAQRIRRNIKAHPFWGKSQTPLQVTASLGLASDVFSLLEPNTLFDQADKCLYQAKSEGRDRVSRVIYLPDQPIAITTSQQEASKEPTLRRHMRAVSQISLEEWSRYLTGHLPQALEAWWKDTRVRDALQNGQEFWASVAEEFTAVLLKNLNSTEDQRNAWLENFQAFPLYPKIQMELSGLIFDGITMTQLEHAILEFYKRTQALIQGAPFPLEERMTVGVIHERLFHVLQLMVAQIWHDVYKATSEHLTLFAKLEQHLAASIGQDELMMEIARLTGLALRADGCLLLLPDEAGVLLSTSAAWGVSGWKQLPPISTHDEMTHICWRQKEACLFSNSREDRRVNQEFLGQIERSRPARSFLMLPLIHRGGSVGVLCCMSEQEDQFTSLDVRMGTKMASRLAATITRNHFEITRQNRYMASVEALADALEQRTTHPPDRLATIAKSLALASGLPSDEVELIAQAVRLHDIGEIAVPPGILEKPHELTSAERELIQTHPVVGASILSYVDTLQDVLPIIRHHHERHDGSGYPDGLQGDDIPLLARILAVADTFDAMTSERPYRERLSPVAALQEMRTSKQFSEELLDNLEKIIARELPRNSEPQGRGSPWAE